MPTRDHLFIYFCLSPRLKVAAYLLGPLAAWLTGSWLALALSVLPLFADLYGAHLVRVYHPSLEEDLTEHLVSGCHTACGIHPGEHHYVFPDSSGSIDHWRLHDLPDQLKLSVLAPKRDYAVMATRDGRIFPPRQYAPPAFDHSDLGCVEIYYHDIQFVELTNGTMRLHTVGGGTHEFPAGGAAADAALYLRQRLRDYKALSSEVRAG